MESWAQVKDTFVIIYYISPSFHKTQVGIPRVLLSGEGSDKTQKIGKTSQNCIFQLHKAKVCAYHPEAGQFDQMNIMGVGLGDLLKLKVSAFIYFLKNYAALPMQRRQILKHFSIKAVFQIKDI